MHDRNRGESLSLPNAPKFVVNAESASLIANEAPAKLASVQTRLANRYRLLVKEHGLLQGQPMSEQAQRAFTKCFLTREGDKLAVADNQRARELVVRAVRTAISAGEITPADIDPDNALGLIDLGDERLPYKEVLSRVRATLAGTPDAPLAQLLEKAGMEEKDRRDSASELAKALARDAAIRRFVGKDLLGIRSGGHIERPNRSAHLHEHNRPQHNSISAADRARAAERLAAIHPSKINPLAAALQGLSIKTSPAQPARPERANTQKPERAPERKQQRAPEQVSQRRPEQRAQPERATTKKVERPERNPLVEMARNFGLEIPVRVGKKIRTVSFILKPNIERDETGAVREGGREWLTIKRAFHVTEKNENDGGDSKKYELTNLKEFGIPNDLVIEKPEDVPDRIVDGMNESGFTNDKQHVFEYLLAAAKDGEARWFDYMRETNQLRGAQEEQQEQ